MKIHSLDIKNIGPFKEAHLDFNADFNAETGQQPVTIITGNNGAGKSIIIDAIRATMSCSAVEREIIADKNDHDISIDLDWNGSIQKMGIDKPKDSHTTILYPRSYVNIPQFFEEKPKSPQGYKFVVDYWTSKLPSDSFKITEMNAINHEMAFADVFKGKKNNVDVTKFLCNIDYLRSSEMPKEKEIGEFLYKKIKEFFNICLDGGEFKYIQRAYWQPIVNHNGHDVTLDQLSSGNILLLEDLLMLLCKMYSISVLNNMKTDEIMDLPGFLLIDEIENHFHPQWQKKILGIIRRLFPNVQIILTTHSPFVVSSIKGAKIYTCVASNEGSSIVDTTDIYDNLPVEEVLLSDVFGVSPFNDEISKLMDERRNYIKAGDMDKAKEKLAELKAINPGYFMFLSPNEY